MSAPSLQPGSWDTNLRHAIEKEGGWAGLGLDYEAIMNSFPVGAVWLWADESTIPSGWQIADEAAGRFLLAAASGETAWEQGGTATHTHDDHVVTQPDTHEWAAITSGSPSTTQTVQSGSGVTVAASNHTHSVQSPDKSHTGSDVDSHSAEDNLPENFKLFVIVKVS